MKTLILLSLVSFNVFAAEKKIMVAEGRFEKVETGDYMHLTLSGPKNEEISLVCSDLPKSLVKGIDCNDLKDNPANFRNKVLRVSYYEEAKMIPEAGQKITWKWVERIDLKK